MKPEWWPVIVGVLSVITDTNFSNMKIENKGGKNENYDAGFSILQCHWYLLLWQQWFIYLLLQYVQLKASTTCSS